MSGQGASGPNYSLIALIVIGAIFLIGFYYADRTSSPADSMAHGPAMGGEGNAIKEAAKKHQMALAKDDRPGFSGSMEEYLTHAEQVQTAKEHVSHGFTGSGSEYLHKGATARSVDSVDGVTVTGQSMEDYLANAEKSVDKVDGVTATGQSMDAYLANSKPGTGPSPSQPAKKPAPSKPSTGSGAASGEHGESFSGSMDAYLNKYGK